MKKSTRAAALAGCAFALVSGFLLGPELPFYKGASNWLAGIASHVRGGDDPQALEDSRRDENAYLKGKNEKWISYYAGEHRESPTSADRDSANSGNTKSRREILMWHLVEVTKNGNDPAGLELCLRWYAQPEKNDGA